MNEFFDWIKNIFDKKGLSKYYIIKKLKWRTLKILYNKTKQRKLILKVNNYDNKVMTVPFFKLLIQILISIMRHRS